MKKYILFLAISMFVTSAFADDFTATQRRNQQAQPRAVAIRPPHGEGAVQYAAKLENPLQGINPFAPAEYGDGSAFVEMYEEYDPSQHTPADKPRGHGVKLFSFAF